MILETTYLVDLERESARSVRGPAHRFLEVQPEVPLYVTFTIAGELAAGCSPSDRERWDGLIAPFRILTCTTDVCWRYGQIERYLRANGRLIGTNDLWIAATALAFNQPVVTANVRHFRRVPEIEVVEYRGGA